MSERETALKEHISRVRLMSEDDGETWDLSENDQAALKAVLAALPVAGADPVPVCQPETWWAVYQDGQPCAAYPRKVQAEVYASGFSREVEIKPLALVPAEGEKP